MKDNNYIFSININQTGMSGIIKICNPPKIICFCNEGNAKLLIKALAELEQEREEETPMLDIALDVVFLKYGDDCVQDINFNTDLGKVYDFIQNMVQHK